MEQPDSKDATHVYYRFGTFFITVEALKMKPFVAGWLFKDARLDFGCMLLNGAGILVDFTLHTKNDHSTRTWTLGLANCMALTSG